MIWLQRIIGFWGIVDSLFLALLPGRWSRWWARWLGWIGEGSITPRLLALVELTFSLLLLLRRESPATSNQHHLAVETLSSASPDRAMIQVERSGLLRAVFRVPRLLYRLGFGWVLGHRFLMLTHRGRKSGRIHQTVLEVVHYDPLTRESVVVSGWGKRADWYRNIRASEAVEVQTAHDRYVPTYRELAPEENYEVVADYMCRLPGPARPIVRRLGFSVEGTEEEQRAHAAALLMIAFRPRSTEQRSDEQ